MRVRVRNAADPEQVKRANRKDRDAVRRRREILADVMALPTGRALVWMILSDTGIYQSPFHLSGSQVYYNIGRADYGRELLAELMAEHSEAYMLMEEEARMFERREATEDAAAHTPSVMEGLENGD